MLTVASKVLCQIQPDSIERTSIEFHYRAVQLSANGHSVERYPVPRLLSLIRKAQEDSVQPNDHT